MVAIKVTSAKMGKEHWKISFVIIDIVIPNIKTNSIFPSSCMVYYVYYLRELKLYSVWFIVS
jgi:hypothetical protein